jgi:hypothetical protein
VSGSGSWCSSGSTRAYSSSSSSSGRKCDGDRGRDRSNGSPKGRGRGRASNGNGKRAAIRRAQQRRSSGRDGRRISNRLLLLLLLLRRYRRSVSFPVVVAVVVMPAYSSDVVAPAFTTRHPAAAPTRPTFHRLLCNILDPEQSVEVCNETRQAAALTALPTMCRHVVGRAKFEASRAQPYACRRRRRGSAWRRGGAVIPPLRCFSPVQCS